MCRTKHCVMRDSVGTEPSLNFNAFYDNKVYRSKENSLTMLAGIPCFTSKLKCFATRPNVYLIIPFENRLQIFHINCVYFIVERNFNP